MEGKKSFVLYTDVKTTVDLLSNEQAGEAFKWIVNYVNDEHPKDSEDALVKMALAPIKAQLKRDLDKWLKRSSINSENGKKGGRPKESEKSESVISKAKKAVNDNVNVNDNDNVIVNDNVILKEERKLKFARSLNPYLEQYGKPMLSEFLEYWTESNDNGKLLRFEMSKNQPFNLDRRLGTWNKKNQTDVIGGKKKQGDGIDAEYIQELKNRLQ